MRSSTALREGSQIESFTYIKAINMKDSEKETCVGVSRILEKECTGAVTSKKNGKNNQQNMHTKKKKSLPLP